MLEETLPDYPALLEGVRRADQLAARKLVEALYPLVIKIVRSHLPRRVAEEDLAQDIFLKMFSRLDQYRAEMPFPHWVSRIAVTTCIDQLRHQKRRPELRWADLSENEAAALDNAVGNTQSASEPDAAQALGARELVCKLLDELSPADRTVITLLDLEQKSVAEISTLTGWGHSMIKVRAFRARLKLQKLFKKLEGKENR